MRSVHCLRMATVCWLMVSGFDTVRALGSGFDLLVESIRLGGDGKLYVEVGNWGTMPFYGGSIDVSVFVDQWHAADVAIPYLGERETVELDTGVYLHGQNRRVIAHIDVPPAAAELYHLNQTMSVAVDAPERNAYASRCTLLAA